ncbi:hypothetical protein BVG16_11075 [Paenibacillus selenitireducens]|jgi:hypothetical protein|uniref:YqzL family protein n=1 Tax=Paenibacillus selenitireducens TaxID=1324314 RepID=A0A1T2XEU4_9BACL|nr:YqzL family protein [Paenibacillus selenitireducens]OPA78417.1 hypothetical protein BVG16_11075 [Paenibacillus selenitireducens]
MRDFSWKYFAMTGDVDAYMLYKEVNSQNIETELEDSEEPVQVDMSE